MECKKYEDMMMAAPSGKDDEILELENKIKEVDGEIVERQDKILRLNVVTLENEKRIKKHINSIVMMSN